VTIDPRPILFVGQNDSGLLSPLLVLAAELAGRGVEELWFAADENRRGDVTVLAGRSAVSFVSMGAADPDSSVVQWDDEAYRQVTQRSRVKAFRAAVRYSARSQANTRKRRRLAQVVATVRPALMVIDCLCGYGIDVALAYGVPYVLSVPFVPSNVLTSHLPAGRSYTPRDFPVPSSGLPYPMTRRQRFTNRMFKLRSLWLATDPGLRRAAAEERRACQELGIPPAGEMTRVDGAELVLCGSLAELDYPFTIPEKVKLVGLLMPPLPERPRGALTSWLDAHESVVYIALGSVARPGERHAAAVVEIARRLGDRHHVLWKLSLQQQHLLPRSRPDNLRVEGWLPSQRDVLAHPHVRAVLHHGGSATYHEAAYFGKPHVVRPVWVDCFDTAARVRDLGLGLSLDRHPTIDPGDVVDKLVRVLADPAFTIRAQRMAALQRSAGGRKTAADLLLQLPALSRKGSAR
jgi:polyene glycosyltransferase